VGKVGKPRAPPLQRSVLSLATRTAQPIKPLSKILKPNADDATLERRRAALAHLPHLQIV
jgi:hypothetical protein